MGRRPKTHSEHLRDGTYRKDRHGSLPSDQDFPGELRLTPPTTLSPDAKRVWKRLVKGFPAEQLRAIDLDLLTTLCGWLVELSRISTALTAESPGTAEHSKLLFSAALASKHVTAIGSKFGMTPHDRAKLKIKKREAVDESNPLEMLRLIGAPKTTTDRGAENEAV